MFTYRRYRSPSLKVAVLLLATVLGACHGGGGNDVPRRIETTPAFDKIKSSGQLNVGYVHYPPIIVKGSEVSGHFADLARHLAAKLEVEIVFHKASWRNYLARLQAGDFDLSVAASRVPEKRPAGVQFSTPIFYLGNSACVSRDNAELVAVTSIEELDRSDLRIATVSGEAAHKFARSNLQEARIEALDEDDLSGPCNAVSAGEADVGLMDARFTKTYAAEHPEVVDLFASNPYGLTPVAWAVREHDTDFLEYINEVLAEVEASGQLRSWEEQHGAHWLHKVGDGWEIW